MLVANIGSYTLLASGSACARTIAFEPVPPTLERLRANCEANKIKDLVDLRAMCLGARDGFVEFSTDSDAMNHYLGE
jgi:FkbM family methyltransferase